MRRVPGGQPEGNDGPENIRAGSIDWGTLLPAATMLGADL